MRDMSPIWNDIRKRTRKVIRTSEPDTARYQVTKVPVSETNDSEMDLRYEARKQSSRALTADLRTRERVLILYFSIGRDVRSIAIATGVAKLQTHRRQGCHAKGSQIGSANQAWAGKSLHVCDKCCLLSVESNSIPMDL